MAFFGQSQVNTVPSPGVAGDFASANANRYSELSGPGGLVAGSGGVTVGRFAWVSAQAMDPDNEGTIVYNYGSGTPAGFVSRPDSPAIITTYLADATMVIQQGSPVPVHSGGDFWCKNEGSTACTAGMKAYANLSTGAVTFAASGSTSSASPAVTGSIATNTAGDAAISMTGSISGNILTVTAVSTGHIYPGTILTGPPGVATGTQVVAQLTSTAAAGALGTTGTYALSIGEQTVASGTVVGTWGLFTVTGGTPTTGGTLTGSSPTATVWGQLTSTTWVVSPSQTAASVTGEVINVETKWIARTGGAAGELVKITDTARSWALGY